MKKYIVAVLLAAGLTMVGCSQKASVEKTSQKFNSLPPAVQQAVRSRAPNAEITSVGRKTRNGMNYFVVEFKEPSRNPKLTVAENGTIITSDAERAMGSAAPESGVLTGTSRKNTDTDNDLSAPKGTTGRAAPIDLSALPVPVQKALKSEAPNAQIKGISRRDENGRMIYDIEFEGQGKNPTIRIAEDGTVVQSLKK